MHHVHEGENARRLRFVAVRLYDRHAVSDSEDLELAGRLARTRAWADAHGVRILSEYIARPMADGIPADALTATLTACVSYRCGLLVWEASLIGDHPTQMWAARQLGPMPLIVAGTERRLVVRANGLYAEPLGPLLTAPAEGAR